MRDVTLYAGTSGFAYREWRGSFYPADMALSGMLSSYADRLPAVEVNATFHRMPARRVMEQWAGLVPGRFRFTLKAPALITHRKKLANAGPETAAFLDAAAGLGTHLGPLLFQLPPWLAFDLSLLDGFLRITDRVETAFEFRHPSWFQDATYRLLEAFGAALCISDREGQPEPPAVPTASFGYLRLRRDEYDAAALKKWRERIDSLGWETAFVFFRHEETGAGTRLAAQLLSNDRTANASGPPR